MTVYCDRLCDASLAALRRAQVGKVVVLDPAGSPAGGAPGLQVEFARFFAGHLRTGDGEAVYVGARRAAGIAALAVSRQLVGATPALAQLNAGYGRDTLRLVLAKLVTPEVERLLLRVLVARALADQEQGEPSALAIWLEAPLHFPGNVLEGVVPGMTLHFYPRTQQRWSILARSVLRSLARRAWGVISPARQRPNAGPSVMSIREDHLSPDHSYRTQLHWLDTATRPSYRILIGAQAADRRSGLDRAMRRFGVCLFGHGDIAAALRQQRRLPVVRKLRRDARACLALAWRSNSARELRVALHVRVLLLRAAEMASLAARFGVRVFVCGEPYMIESDAMQLAAPDLGVTTITFQYSNLAFMSPPMLTTADRMLCFSDIYRPVWSADGIAPRGWAACGYVFDGAAALVRDRARALRTRLNAAGADYVICYFDESVQRDRWGCVHERDHHAELVALAQLLLADPALGLVVKSQFQRNSPSRLHPDDPVLRAAQASGRYAELCVGAHRNLVFPSEAALAADICIGHLLGATASLEAALAGVRSVMLNTMGMRTECDRYYRQADIVYPSMQALLAAIDALRRGDPRRRALGDWSPIVYSFDPFHDGRAAKRLREAIEGGLPLPRSATTPRSLEHSS